MLDVFATSVLFPSFVQRKQVTRSLDHFLTVIMVEHNIDILLFYFGCMYDVKPSTINMVVVTNVSPGRWRALQPSAHSVDL